MAGLDQIKRQARKEAWYGDSWNPFGKAGKRSSTWANPSPTDIEAGNGISTRRNIGVVGAEDETPLSAVQTEPPHSRSFSTTTDGNTIRRHSKDNEYEMTTATATNTSKPREADSEETVVPRATRPPSQEEKARRRFVRKFFKNKEEKPEGEDKLKKRPWYKGKELYHKEPFTLRNQVRRTIFSSWVNILLIAAPVGIALNYAGVDGKVVFTVNFIAIIPLAGMLSFATEEIALHLGESLGGLLNASFGWVFLQFQGDGFEDQC